MSTGVAGKIPPTSATTGTTKLTSAQKKQLNIDRLHHVLVKLVGIPDDPSGVKLEDSDLYKALMNFGVTNWTDLLLMSKHDIDDLHYETMSSGTNVIVKVKTSEKRQIQAAITYYHLLSKSSGGSRREFPLLQPF